MTVQEKRANFKSQMMDSSRMKVLCGAFDGITARAAQAADFLTAVTWAVRQQQPACWVCRIWVLSADVNRQSTPRTLPPVWICPFLSTRTQAMGMS